VFKSSVHLSADLLNTAMFLSFAHAATTTRPALPGISPSVNGALDEVARRFASAATSPTVDARSRARGALEEAWKRPR